MLRWMMPVLAAVFAVGSAAAADLPRYGAGVYRPAPLPYGRPAYVEEDSDLLFTPSADGGKLVLAEREELFDLHR